MRLVYVVSIVASVLATLGVRVVSVPIEVPVFTSDTQKHVIVLKPELAHEHRDFAANVFDDAQWFNVSNIFVGYIAGMTKSQAFSIAQMDSVDYVEEDNLVHTCDIEVDPPSWGLARSSYRHHPSESEFHKYLYYSKAGEGVVAYSIDTGVNVHHEDFENRAVWGVTIPKDDVDEDHNGHGTHTSATMIGKAYGIAKKATLVAVKVLRSDGSGTLSDVILGVDWVVRHHQNRGKAAKSVANLSLGGSKTRALDAAIDAAVESGIFVAVAAGNSAEDACKSSPAASKLAITVGASDVDDKMAWFSNHGKCVDIFAGGKDITSAWIGPGNNEAKTISGTSMATPLTCAIGMLIMSEHKYANLTPKEIKNLILEQSTKDLVTGIPEWSKTPNRLIFNGGENGL